MASLTAHSPSLMQACSSRTASKGATKLCSPLLPSLRCVPAPACVQPAAAQAQQQQCQRAGQRRAAVAVRAEPEGGASTSTMPPPESDWVAVCRPEDLPKGVRKELEIDGRQVLLFWYRNQIYCTQARSPAEGAYSEGFIKAKFTQDYCIECPSTGSLFSLNDGSIKSWYPNNSVLRALTPQDTCPPLEIFPVKLTQEAIFVDVSTAQFRGPAGNRGGAGTSIDNNNVFTVGPTVYFDGMDPTQENATPLMTPNAKQDLNPAVVVLAIGTVAAVGIVGYAIVQYALS